MIEELKLNTHPTCATLFAHYTRVVYLAQTEDATLVAARSVRPISFLLEVIQTGMGDLQSAMTSRVLRWQDAKLIRAPQERPMPH